MANQNIILPAEVTEGGILRKTPLNVRFDQQLIAPNIQVAELRWIKPLLGDALYDDFVADQVAEAFPPTVPKFNDANYQILWDKYLWSFDSLAVTWASLPGIAMPIGANGIYLNNTDTSENAGAAGLKLRLDSIYQNLLVLSDEIKKYLCANAVDFPLYDAALNCGCDGLAKNTGSSQRLHVVLRPRKQIRRGWINPNCDEC